MFRLHNVNTCLARTEAGARLDDQLVKAQNNAWNSICSMLQLHFSVVSCIPVFEFVLMVPAMASVG